MTKKTRVRAMDNFWEGIRDVVDVSHPNFDDVHSSEAQDLISEIENLIDDLTIDQINTLGEIVILSNIVTKYDA